MDSPHLSLTQASHRVTDSRYKVLCKQIVRVCHAFELKSITAGVLEEHRILLPWLAFEAQVGLDDEVHASLLQLLSQILKVVDRQG